MLSLEALVPEPVKLKAQRAATTLGFAAVTLRLGAPSSLDEAATIISMKEQLKNRNFKRCRGRL